MRLCAATTDTIDITLPDGSVVSATGEAWVKWLVRGQELLTTCEFELAPLNRMLKRGITEYATATGFAPLLKKSHLE